MFYSFIRKATLKVSLTTAFVIIVVVFAQGQTDLKLWYDKPADAKIWEQALPIGNGRLGAMVYGIPQREQLQLNEETIWGGGPYRNDNEKGGAALPQIQQLIFDGKTGEADKLINETFFTKTHGMPFQTAGSLVLHFSGHETYSNYTRELDLEKAVATAKYMVDGVTYTREVFSSFADDVIIMQLTASKKGALNFTVEYNNPADHKVFKEGNRLVLEGKGASHEGIEGKIVYQTHTTVKN